MQEESGTNDKMICKICKRESRFIFDSIVLKKIPVKYYFCDNCGFMHTEEPYWLKESYQESINFSDTGILQRNNSLSKISTLLIYFFFKKKSKFLDYAGGYGIFTRLMRDIGFEFYWHDKYTTNLVARGFEYNKNHNYNLITTFESFEHFSQPLIEIENMLRMSKNILFTTELFNPLSIPKVNEWWYYGLDHGQHISFFSKKTLEYIAKKYDLNLVSNNSNFHLLTEKKINGKLFNLILKFNRIGINSLINTRIKSKTIEDMISISKNGIN